MESPKAVAAVFALMLGCAAIGSRLASREPYAQGEELMKMEKDPGF